MGKDINSFSLDDFKLDGKVAMITGANQGLGIVYATALSKAGADIFIPHFTPDIDEVKGIVEGNGRKIGFYQGDLTKAEDREATVKACMDQFGRIDILINNAGNNFMSPILDFPENRWEQVLNLQLHSVFYMSQAVARIMKEQGGGKIINIASALSYAADLNADAYCVAKHGIIGMTKSFAAELGQYNIMTNAIAPGFFATAVNADMRAANKTLFQGVIDRTSMLTDDWGDVYTLMGLAVFLSSPASDFINGIDIAVDGGFKAQML
jgi:2-deoxy-D-gluconate 3-dehydrogenase